MARKIKVILLTGLICLAILEVGLRAIGRKPTNMADGIAAQHGDTFRLKKNITKVLKFPAFSYTVHTNEFGFRDSRVGPRDLAGGLFCVFLGASDVFGNGVGYEDSFVGIFAREAEKKGLMVLNCAIGGHYFLDQEELLKEFIESTGKKPSKIFMTVNALHIPKFDRRNRNVVVKSGYVIDRSGWQIAYLRLMAGNISSAFCFFRDGIRRIQERYLNYELTEKSPEFLQIYSINNEIRQPDRIRKFEQYLSDFESFCSRNDIELVYIYLPLSDSFRLKDLVKQLGLDPAGYDSGFFEGLMRSHCASSRIRLLNPRPVLEKYHEEGHDLRFKLDPHYNQAANGLIGKYLVHELLGD